MTVGVAVTLMTAGMMPVAADDDDDVVAVPDRAIALFEPTRTGCCMHHNGEQHLTTYTSCWFVCFRELVQQFVTNERLNKTSLCTLTHHSS